VHLSDVKAHFSIQFSGTYRFIGLLMFDDWDAEYFCSNGDVWLALRGHPLPLMFEFARDIVERLRLLI